MSTGVLGWRQRGRGRKEKRKQGKAGKQKDRKGYKGKEGDGEITKEEVKLRNALRTGFQNCFLFVWFFKDRGKEKEKELMFVHGGFTKHT